MDAVLDYVAFITLGPALVEGNVASSRFGNNPEIRNGIEQMVGLLSQAPDFWAGRDFANLLRQKEFSPKVRSEFRLQFAGGAAAEWSSGLHSKLSEGEPVETLPGDFVLGVLLNKEPDDPPYCYKTAIRIVQRGLEEESQREFDRTVGRRDVRFESLALKLPEGWGSEATRLRGNLLENG
ncbi:MAG: hypothetical protein L3K14_04860 [Thermoplasmata archaeon]|nr:hypothetical protein [Thermoplasmata archaeon]